VGDFPSIANTESQRVDFVSNDHKAIEDDFANFSTSSACLAVGRQCLRRWSTCKDSPTVGISIHAVSMGYINEVCK
jgi:hypothetical protein